MNTASRGEGGVPRSRRPLAAAPPHRAAPEETWLGANEDKHAKLRRNRLQRRAGARGLELRHSDAGYALIDSARKRVEDRGDMTLDEIESWLERA